MALRWSTSGFLALGPRAPLVARDDLGVETVGAEVWRNIADAVQGFFETAREQGTLNDILQEAGYRFENGRWNEPELVGVEQMSVGLR